MIYCCAEVIPLHFNTTTVLPHFIYFTVLFDPLSQIAFLSPRCVHSNQVPVLKDLVAANYSHLLFIFCSIF